MMLKTKLTLGRILITPNAREILTDYEVFAALARHQSGDWGEVCEADRQANICAVKQEMRVLSSYRTVSDDKFWIITEADRSYTTILLPEDY